MRIVSVRPPASVIRKKKDEAALHHALLLRLDGRKQGKLQKTKARFLSAPRKKEKPSPFPYAAIVRLQPLPDDDPLWKDAWFVGIEIESLSPHRRDPKPVFVLLQLLFKGNVPDAVTHLAAYSTPSFLRGNGIDTAFLSYRSGERSLFYPLLDWAETYLSPPPFRHCPLREQTLAKARR